MKKNKYTAAESAILKRIGNNIRLYRNKREIAQEELADLCKIDRTYMGSIERAETNPTVLKLSKIADALDIELTKLIG